MDLARNAKFQQEKQALLKEIAEVENKFKNQVVLDAVLEEYRVPNSNINTAVPLLIL